MIPGDLLSAFPHRQFHTLPGLLDSWAALPNSYPNALRAMQGGSLYHFYDGLWYDPAERRTHDLPCERRTRYRLSQPDTVGHSIVHPELFGQPWTEEVKVEISKQNGKSSTCWPPPIHIIHTYYMSPPPNLIHTHYTLTPPPITHTQWMVETWHAVSGSYLTHH